MTSTIKVDTISENTSANGVAIDGLTIKDGGITATTGAIVFNEAAADLDFRVESNNNVNMLFVNGGTDRVGIGTALPGAILEVVGPGARPSSLAEVDTASTAKFTSDTSNADSLYIAEGDSGALIQVNDGATNSSTAKDLQLQPFGGNVAIGTTDPQTTLHVEGTAPIIRISDSNSTSEDDAVGKIEFYDRNNTDLNAEIVSGTGSLADFIISAHNNRAVLLKTNTAEGLRVTGSGQIGLNEDSVDVTQGGITMQQGGNDGNILTFKSSDIAHGITNTAETDTYFEMKKQSASIGGVAQTAYSEQKLAHAFEGFVGLAEESSPSAASFGPFYFNASIKSGTSIAEMSAAQHLFAVANDGDAKFMIDGDGTFHSDGAGGTYDTYEDAQLVRAFDLSHMEGVINSKFDKFVQYNHEDLAAAKLVGREPDGTPNHFINYPAFNRLHNGAIWQQYEKHQKLASAFYKLAEKTIGKEEADKLLTEEEIQLLN